MSLLANLPDRCTIQRRVRSRGSLGGSKSAPIVVQTDVPCWQQQTSSAEAAEFEKKGHVISTKVYFTSDPGVTGRYQIVMTSRNGTAIAGETPLDVVDSPSPDVSVGRGLLWRVACSINRGEDD